MHVRVGFEEPFFAFFDGAAEFAVLGVRVVRLAWNGVSEEWEWWRRVVPTSGGRVQTGDCVRGVGVEGEEGRGYGPPQYMTCLGWYSGTEGWMSVAMAAEGLSWCGCRTSRLSVLSICGVCLGLGVVGAAGYRGACLVCVIWRPIISTVLVC